MRTVCLTLFDAFADLLIRLKRSLYLVMAVFICLKASPKFFLSLYFSIMAKLRSRALLA